MARLTAQQRHGLGASEFALPGGRYPIEDPNHARNALARGAQHASPAELSRIKAAVHRKYPSIEVGGKPTKRFADGGKVEVPAKPATPPMTSADIDSTKVPAPGTGAVRNNTTGQVTNVGKPDPVAKYANGGVVGAVSNAIERTAGAFGADKAKVIEQANNITKPAVPDQAGGDSNRANAIAAAEAQANGPAPGAKYAKGGPVQNRLRMAPHHRGAGAPTAMEVNMHGMPIHSTPMMTMNQARIAKG